MRAAAVSGCVANDPVAIGDDAMLTSDTDERSRSKPTPVVRHSGAVQGVSASAPNRQE